MDIEQYVMAYSVDHDKLRAILPDGFISIRPVLRINAEVINDGRGYVELNTAVLKDGSKGWLNICFWEDVPFTKAGKSVTFMTDFLEISFTGTGIEGSCPAEKDNAGCYFIDGSIRLKMPEAITANKEFCDCSFRWKFSDTDAHGVSSGKTLPAYPTEVLSVYPKEKFSVENAVKIPCGKVLGAYVVKFTR